MGKNNSFIKYFAITAIVLFVSSIVIAQMSSSGNDEGVVLEPRIKGGSDAAVVLVEYSDFECPACRSAYPIVKELNDEFGDRLKIEYRHFPLTQIHPNAMLAAQAAEAAGVQGKFWEMHDLLFENQPAWSRGGTAKGAFISYAEELGLDVEQFSRQINSSRIKEKIRADMSDGRGDGVQGTPSFFLNGERVQNAGSAEEFMNLVRGALGEPTVTPEVEAPEEDEPIEEGEGSEESADEE